MNHTRTGDGIRATAQNARAASVLGIDTRRIYAMTFGIGAALAGAAGSLVAMVYSFTPVTGDSLTMKAFVIVVLGGLGSMHGATLPLSCWVSPRALFRLDRRATRRGQLLSRSRFFYPVRAGCSGEVSCRR
jgi:ABC-type branched-subunit amino acid transport system permease subunit